MGNSNSKEGSWQWWEMLFIAAVVLFVVTSSICHLCGCCKVGSLGLRDLVNFILNALVVVGLGMFLAGRQERFTRGITKQQRDLAKGIEKRQRNHDAEIAEQQEYSTAIDYLSSSNPAVRLKGVRALDQHAKNTQDLDTKEEIWGLLNDHVRYYTRDTDYQKSFPQEPSIDIQGTIDIQIRAKPRPRINWSGAWLRGAELNRAQLQGARLEGAQLQEASLWEAQLQGVSLREAQLQGARLMRTQLQGANLGEARLLGANLWEAQLQGAYLGKTQLQGANLYKVQLQEAHLWGAQLQGVHGSGGSLRGVAAIRHRVGKDAELDTVVFEGGLTKFNIEMIRNNINLDAGHWSDEQRQDLRHMLSRLENDHCREVIRGSNEEYVERLIDPYVALGSYSEEKAHQWIKKLTL